MQGFWAGVIPHGRLHCQILKNNTGDGLWMRNKQPTQRKQLLSFLPHKESSRSSNVSNNYIRWRWFRAPLLFGGEIWWGQLDEMTLRWESFCIYATNPFRRYVKGTTRWCGWAWERREVSCWSMRAARGLLLEHHVKVLQVYCGS